MASRLTLVCIRSGVIRVNDVIAKVDDEDVQGQPLSTLRNLILGKQGTYVVLAFRRMTGTELYYYDVELVRGTPEYFESLKKSQVVQDEKEKLLLQVVIPWFLPGRGGISRTRIANCVTLVLHQVRQQEQDILALKQQNTQMTRAAPAPPPAALQAAAPPPPPAQSGSDDTRRQIAAKNEVICIPHLPPPDGARRKSDVS